MNWAILRKYDKCCSSLDICKLHRNWDTFYIMTNYSLHRRASRVCSEAPLRVEVFQKRTNVRPVRPLGSRPSSKSNNQLLSGAPLTKVVRQIWHLVGQVRRAKIKKLAWSVHMGSKTIQMSHCPTCPAGWAALKITIFIIWLWSRARQKRNRVNKDHATSV